MSSTLQAAASSRVDHLPSDTPTHSNGAEAEAIVRELFLTPEGRTDPYPRYHRLRAAAPVHRSTSLKMWLVSRYEDGWAALRDPRLGRDFAREMALRHGEEWRRYISLAQRERSMLNLEGAAHTRLRKLVSKAFTPRTIERMRPSIERTVHDLLDGLAKEGGGDFLEQLAFPLPVTVIGELLGVPEADRAQFRGLIRDSVAVFELRPSEADFAAADHAQVVIQSYFEGLIAEKRRHPDDGMLSRLAFAEDGGDRLTDQELYSMASLLFAAGFETTTNLLGNGLLGLLHHPAELARLRENPALFANLSDEILRYDGTAQMVVRTARAPVVIGNETIAEGETVLILLGAGNHDPSRYADPDRLDVTRTDISPLSFGGGVHFCLGAALARAETEITLRCMLERFPALAQSAVARFRDRLTLRGLETMPISCGVGRTVQPRERVAAGEAATPASSCPMHPHAAPASSAAPAMPSKPVSLESTSSVLAVRPRGDGSGADAPWRDALRSQVERENMDTNFPAARAGLELAATAALLARTPLFRRCTPIELAELAATAYPITFEAGDLLCVEASEALECYAIAEGEATVSIGEKVLATVGPDDVVGERGPLEGRTRTATVKAATHMLTYAISRQRLLALASRSPGARAGMFAYMEGRYQD